MYKHTRKARRVIASRNRRAAGSSLVLEAPDGSALVVKAHYKDYWTIPGGFIDETESPLEAAVRETHEETGLMIDPNDVSFLFVVDRKSPVAETYHFVFRASVSADAFEHLELQASEITDAKLVTKDEVLTNATGQCGGMIRFWAENRQGYIEQHGNS